MKKDYFSPAVQTQTIALHQLICVSATTLHKDEEGIEGTEEHVIYG